jgi:hypothetical protein
MEYPLHARKQSDEEMATKDRPMVPEKRSGRPPAVVFVSR